MPRVKRSISARKKRRTVLSRAKGYYGAKSRTRRSRALAIRGVPRLRLAISTAAFDEQGTSRMRAERWMMVLSTSLS